MIKMPRQLNKGIEFAKILKAIRNRELLLLALFTTERCNSHCQNCRIWAKENPMDMPISMIENIIDDVPNAEIAIGGGEAILHPNIEEIIKLFNQKKRSYVMISNGIKADYLEFLVNEYGVPNLGLSCDGTWEVYQQARGVDNYDNIIYLLRRLKGKTNLHLSYLVSEWNNREELLQISELSKQYNVGLHVDCYDEIPYYDTTAARIKKIYKADDVQSYPTNKCLRLYNKWIGGDYKIPCHMAKYTCSVGAGGDVFCCERQPIILGNLNEQKLSVIWHSAKTIKIQDELVSCNKCLATCHRAVDVAISDLIPKLVRL